MNEVPNFKVLGIIRHIGRRMFRKKVGFDRGGKQGNSTNSERLKFVTPCLTGREKSSLGAAVNA